MMPCGYEKLLEEIKKGMPTEQERMYVEKHILLPTSKRLPRRFYRIWDVMKKEASMPFNPRCDKTLAVLDAELPANTGEIRSSYDPTSQNNIELGVSILIAEHVRKAVMEYDIDDLNLVAFIYYHYRRSIPANADQRERRAIIKGILAYKIYKTIHDVAKCNVGNVYIDDGYIPTALQFLKMLVK